MRPPWLLLDCNYICYRAYYSMGDLSYGDVETGIAFGFLREVLQLQDLFGTVRIAFAFDSGASKRRAIYPAYKSGRRKEKSEEKEQEHRSIIQQINAIRRDYIPYIGYSNVFHQKGYEADDIIASLVNGLKKKERAIIVSSDSDLLQLLSNRVSIWNLKKQEMITKASFEKEWGLDPGLWSEVKAIAGCSTDNIKGIKGVGEKTAAAFVTGALNTGKKFDAVVYGNKIIKRNLRLVTLPYPGTKEFRLRIESVGQRGWANIAKRLGMKHLFDYSDNAPRPHNGINREDL